MPNFTLVAEPIASHVSFVVMLWFWEDVILVITGVTQISTNNNMQ